MQCACAILSSVDCLALQYFSKLSHKRHDFRKKKVSEHILMCVLIFSITSVWNISHSKKKLARYDNKMYVGRHVKYLFSCTILMKLEFSRQFSKNPGIPNFMKRRQVRAELFHADGLTDRRTDMTKLIFAFCNFANAPNNLEHPRALRCLFWQSLPLVRNNSLSSIATKFDRLRGEVILLCNYRPPKLG
jgi:hypothetical protein